MKPGAVSAQRVSCAPQVWRTGVSVRSALLNFEYPHSAPAGVCCGQSCRGRLDLIPARESWSSWEFKPHWPALRPWT